ncbi:MAG: hypothetical protein M3Y23_01800, partial [Actinomycetota bacterium]|nr:hypothetical protein [Actinomycetota bacterium]
MADRTATGLEPEETNRPVDSTETAPLRPYEEVRNREAHHEPDPIKGGAPKAGIEGWLVALLFAAVYGVVGYFVVTDGRIVSFNALHALNDSYMVWWNSPPKLAAIGLNVAPLGSVMFLPLALVKPLATSLVALPVASALAAGVLMAILNSILRRAEMAAGIRFVMLLLFGLNPMFVYYAGNGEPVMFGMLFAGISLLSLISWKMTGETRYIVGAGIGMSIAMMVDYGYALWAVGFAITIMAIGSGSTQDRLRSALMLFLTPVAYALLVWVLLNWVIIGSPFGWLTAQTGFIQVNTTGVLQAVTSSPGDALGDLFSVVLGIAPLGFAALVLLLVSGILKRDGLTFGLFIVALLAIAVPLIRVLVADEAQLMALSVGLPLALLALGAMAAIFAVEEGWRVGVGAVMAIGLIAAIPLGWNAMQDYEYQNQAQAFTRFIEDRDSQEGTSSVGGYTVGVDPEVAMANFIKNELPQDKDQILVDENFSYGPMLLSGRPHLFYDRADRGEGNWEAVKDNPFGEVNYMLITVSRAGDQLRKEWPLAVSGGENGMTPIFRTDRYVLVEIAETAPSEPSEGDASDESQPQSTPRPVTPERPPTPGEDSPDESVPATGTPQSSPDPAPGQSATPESGSADPPVSSGSSESSAPEL